MTLPKQDLIAKELVFLNDQNEAQFPVFYTNKRTRVDRLDGAVSYIRNVLFSEFNYTPDDANKISGSVFRHAVTNWSMRHPNPNVRHIAARAMSHGYDLHSTTYNQDWGDQRLELFEDLNNALKPGASVDIDHFASDDDSSSDESQVKSE